MVTFTPPDPQPSVAPEIPPKQIASSHQGATNIAGIVKDTTLTRCNREEADLSTSPGCCMRVAGVVSDDLLHPNHHPFSHGRSQTDRLQSPRCHHHSHDHRRYKGYGSQSIIYIHLQRSWLSHEGGRCSERWEYPSVEPPPLSYGDHSNRLRSPSCHGRSKARR